MYFRYVKDYPNTSAYDFKSLKDFMKDILLSINIIEDKLDLAEGTVIVY